MDSANRERLELRLGQFLKLANMVGSGGEGKVAIQNGEVKVNGEVETRRGRHLCLSDVVEFRGRRVAVASIIKD